MQLNYQVNKPATDESPCMGLNPAEKSEPFAYSQNEHPPENDNALPAGDSQNGYSSTAKVLCDSDSNSQITAAENILSATDTPQVATRTYNYIAIMIVLSASTIYSYMYYI